MNIRHSIAAMLFCALAACNGLGTTAADSSEIERTIDAQIPASLHQSLPDLPSGSARCPDGITFSHPATVRCIYDVAGTSLPVYVSVSPGSNKPSVQIGAALLDTRKVARFTAATLQQHFHKPVTVACGDRYQAFAFGTKITCLLHGNGYPSAVDIGINRDGSTFVYYPPQMKAPPDPLASVIAKHEAGARAVAAGVDVAAYLHTRQYLAGIAATGSPVAAGTFACPTTMDLTGTRTGDCTLTLGPDTVHVEVAIRNGQWLIRQTDGIIDRASLEAGVAKHFGFPVSIVHCNSAAHEVAPYPIILRCSVSKPRQAVRYALVSMHGADGAVYYALANASQ